MQPMRRDPAPSRWGYRYQRLMLTPAFRRFLFGWGPVVAVLALLGGWAADAENRQVVTDRWAAMVSEIQSRPEFMVNLMAIDGADEATMADIRTVLPVEFPVSSFDLDLEEMRSTVAALNAVEDARMRIRAGGVLQVDVTLRRPVAIWRDQDGLKLIDAGGAVVAPVAARAERADLPLVVGDGARRDITEALALYAAARPLGDRVRALVRMGERRWDLVLDRNQRILLPEDGAVRALNRVIALHQAQDLLERDVAVVDIRNRARPTVRLNENAVESLRQTGAEAMTE